MHMLQEGHIALAASLRNEPFYLAWGTIPEGDPVWSNNPPPIAADAKRLIQEVGRRKVTLASYCYEDAENGTVEANNKLWSLTNDPTRHLYLQFKFSSSDNADKTVYQMAVFSGTKTNPAMAPFSAEINHVGGYDTGETLIRVSPPTVGSLQDLLPYANLSKDGGRKVTIAGQTVRVKAIDTAASTITISPLTAPIANGTTVNAAAVTAVPPGRHYVTPNELLDPGTIFLGENRTPIFRNSSVREAFEIVITL